jgi:phosphoglycolate phosphatase-like HAD superfamily hydrolase
MGGPRSRSAFMAIPTRAFTSASWVDRCHSSPGSTNLRPTFPGRSYWAFWTALRQRKTLRTSKSERYETQQLPYGEIEAGMTETTHLVLFDIDGTLTQSQSIDSEIYLQTLSELFGFNGLNSDWSTYRHTTDSGILREVFETQLGRGPTVEEIETFRAHFVNAIANAASATPFREIAGAGRVLHHISALPSHFVGLATGGWRDSARCKMRSAGLDYDAFPSASAEDAEARASIMKIAIGRMTARAGGRRPDTIVYVGDGIWDARACRELKVPFLGIGAGAHAEVLRAEGATEVFEDYSDLKAFYASTSGLKIGRR